MFFIIFTLKYEFDFFKNRFVVSNLKIYLKWLT